MLEMAPDHDISWFEIYGRVAVTGEPIRFVNEAKVAILFNDITARKKAEHERKRLVGQFREQDVRKDEFPATLAHELRNPLAPIRNGLELMKRARNDGETSEKVRGMMERQVGTWSGSSTTCST